MPNCHLIFDMIRVMFDGQIYYITKRNCTSIVHGYTEHKNCVFVLTCVYVLTCGYKEKEIEP